MKLKKLIKYSGVIIPKKTIYELSKLLSDLDEQYRNDSISSNKIIFFMGDIIFISKLIDGSFPDYKRVIPNDNKYFKINREKLLSAVDRVSTIANEKSPVIKFKLLKDLINLNTINNENSTATEDLNVNMKEMKLKLVLIQNILWI